LKIGLKENFEKRPEGKFVFIYLPFWQMKVYVAERTLLLRGWARPCRY
jgi:hypothetical protein